MEARTVRTDLSRSVLQQMENVYLSKIKILTKEWDLISNPKFESLNTILLNKTKTMIAL